MIKNLSQLKKAIAAGRRFEIIEHFYHPKHVGQIRKPTKIQTNAFYSVVDGQPEHEVSRANDGKGYYMSYGKAKNWKFEGEKITALDYLHNGDESPVMTIRFID